MITSALFAALLLQSKAPGFSVTWKVTVAGKFASTDKFGRECTAELSHVYEGATKVYDRGAGYVAGSVKEATDVDMVEFNKSRIFSEVGQTGAIAYKISDTYGWTRKESFLVEGYEGTLAGSGLSKPVKHLSLSINTVTNECRLWVNFRLLEGGAPLKNSFEEYYIEGGKKRVETSQPPTPIDARTGGQGVDMIEGGPFVGFIRAKGTASLKGKQPAVYRMPGGKGAELPIEIQVEASLKRLSGK